ncbi:MAG: GNAT family N-acetyltransferase [Bacteroidales bacterium]|nr:GNAT family N-acetyltransferase [Bacteroidales bacterium]
MEVRVIEFGSNDYKKSIELRDKILRKPLGMVFTDEFLSQDKEQINIAAFDNEIMVGILLLKKINDKILKMRQVAVDENRQGQGIGKQMVIFSEKYAKQNGFTLIELNARDTAIPFYQSLDYKIVSEEFFEVGISHKKMEKDLKI